MHKEKVYVTPNLVTPNQPIQINEDICTGCNMCVDVCRSDVFVYSPSPDRKRPVVLYPDECWYCGDCVYHCPLWQKGCITIKHPLSQNWIWKNKETGKHAWLGMLNPPEPNLKDPVGGWPKRGRPRKTKEADLQKLKHRPSAPV